MIFLYTVHTQTLTHFNKHTALFKPPLADNGWVESLSEVIRNDRINMLLLLSLVSLRCYNCRLMFICFSFLLLLLLLMLFLLFIVYVCNLQLSSYCCCYCYFNCCFLFLIRFSLWNNNSQLTALKKRAGGIQTTKEWNCKTTTNFEKLFPNFFLQQK